jgi:hypothetical protein
VHYLKGEGLVVFVGVTVVVGVSVVVGSSVVLVGSSVVLVGSSGVVVCISFVADTGASVVVFVVSGGTGLLFGGEVG